MWESGYWQFCAFVKPFSVNEILLVLTGDEVSGKNKIIRLIAMTLSIASTAEDTMGLFLKRQFLA